MKKIIIVTILSVLVGNLFSQSGCVGVDIKNSVTNSTGDFTLRCQDSCITLKVDVRATGITANDYTVESIPFNPPYPFTAGTSVMVGMDDVWGDLAILPFKFCFYGVIQNRLVPSTNGNISFDTMHARQYQANPSVYPGQPWAFTASIPSPTFPNSTAFAQQILNSVYGVYQDTDPRYGSSQKGMYVGLLGTYPCRTYVVSWNEIGMFQCNAMLATSQIVLYENSNIIDVYVLNRPVCSTWNSGNGLIGLQNHNGTAAKTPPGRNTGSWTASNEAWRFKPVGDPQYFTYWYDENDNLVDMNVDSIIVCPSKNTHYTVKVEYTSCNEDNIEFETRVNISVDTLEHLAQITATYDTVCTNQLTTLTATGGNRFEWSTGELTPSITVTPNAQMTYSVRTFRNNCHSDTSKTIYLFNPTIAARGATICLGDTATIGVIDPEPTSTYVWSDGSTGAEIQVAPNADMVYSVTATNQRGCESIATATVRVISPLSFSITESEVCKNTTGTLTANGNFTYRWSNGTTGSVLSVRMGTQSTTYRVTATDTNGCRYTDSATIHVFPDFVITTVGSEICKGDTGIVTASGAHTYLWSTGHTGNLMSAVAHTNTTYTVTGTDTNGCPNTATGSIKIRKNPVANFIASSYKVQNDAPPVNFYDQSTGDPVIWNWSFGDGNISSLQNPSNQYTDVGTFNVWLSIADMYGCKDSISRQVKVIPPFSFFMPNSFSPDGDGVNEVFKPEGEGAMEGSYEMLIYDRWGKLVFKTTTPYDGWDGKSNGKPLPMGVYVYTVKLVTPEDEYKTYKGEVMLIR